jgi:hypothetical protein
MCAQQVSHVTSKKICFVIAPIGDSGDSARIRSDEVFEHIIAPAANACGYEALRADKISKPGIITSQIIQHLIDDPLVIADLTGPNANVFYELAIRHAFQKPVVQIIDAEQSIPFDVAQSRTIKFNYPSLGSAAKAREEIKQHIKAVEDNPGDADNPLTQAVELQSLRRSGNPLEKSAAEMIAMLGDVKGVLNDIQQKMKKGEVTLGPSYFAAVEDFSEWPVGRVKLTPTPITPITPIRLSEVKVDAQESTEAPSERGQNTKAK